MTEEEAIQDLLATLRNTPPGGWVPPLQAWADMCGIPHHRAYGGASWKNVRDLWRARRQEGERTIDERIWQAIQEGRTRQDIADELNVGFTRIERVKEQRGFARRARHDWDALEADLRRRLSEAGRVHIKTLVAEWGMPRSAIDSWASRSWKHIKGGYRRGWFFFCDAER